MAIGSVTSNNLMQTSFSQANKNAKIMQDNPVDGSVGLMNSANGVKIASKAIRAQDEILGTILDIRA